MMLGFRTSSFNRLAWSAPTADCARGILAAGLETGEVNVFDPAKILAGSKWVCRLRRAEQD